MDVALARPALRILVIDDDASVYEDFRKLGGGFDVDSVHPAGDGAGRVRRAVADGRPYAVAFVDSRQAETVRRVWQADPALQVVLCGAPGNETVAALGETDRLLILRKPFDAREVRQLASVLTAKWSAERRARARVEEVALRHTHKLEAMGRLAAGIAHEINSPMQFVSCSLDFIRQSLPTILPLIEVARADNPDLDFLADELPAALEDAAIGVSRVTKIVYSMRSLSHPGQTILSPVDVNLALQSALTVCQSEIRQHADIVRELGDVPAVLGNAADLGQTFLNLIINAADAIRDVTDHTQRRGTLRVKTRVADGCVVAAIADDGPGIPADIRDKIFEPFFTTKEVGRGTGQGLAIARTMVVERFGGTLQFETEVGKGTTFFVRLPIPQRDEVAA